MLDGTVLSGRLIAALHERSLTPSQRLLYAELMMRADAAGRITAATDDLVRTLDVSEITILSGLTRLSFLGLIGQIDWDRSIALRYVNHPRDGRKSFRVMLAGEAGSE